MPNRKSKPKFAVFVIGPSIAYIPLTRGHFSCVDWDDAIKVECLRWHSDGRYARRRDYTIGGRFVFMHQFLSPSPDGLVNDHINGCGFDNRRHNLRHVTQMQNMWNTKVYRSSRTGIKGVSPNKSGKRWEAKITANGVVRYLGSFSTKEEASDAYRAGKFACHIF